MVGSPNLQLAAAVALVQAVWLAGAAATDAPCNVTFDSRDPRAGPVRAGDDLHCTPLADANDTLGGCAAVCCDEPLCQSFSWNAPWTLPPPAYMGCVAGRNCCCLKGALPPLEPNKWNMNITTIKPIKMIMKVMIINTKIMATIMHTWHRIS